MVKWSVDVITADVMGAGTDSYIYLDMYFDTGSSHVTLDNPNGSKFQRGGKDHFEKESYDVGALRYIHLKRLKYKDRVQAWKVDQVRLG